MATIVLAACVVSLFYGQMQMVRRLGLLAARCDARVSAASDAVIRAGEAERTAAQVDADVKALRSQVAQAIGYGQVVREGLDLQTQRADELEAKLEQTLKPSQVESQIELAFYRTEATWKREVLREMEVKLAAAAVVSSPKPKLAKKPWPGPDDEITEPAGGLE
jgi:hypothetical protein